jgi:DNA-binding Xre family transcriptional regulator
MVIRLSKEKVIRRMHTKGIHSLGELAEAVDRNQPTVSAWFSGVFDPRLSTLAALCSLLGCTIDDLVDYIPDELAGATSSFAPALVTAENGAPSGVAA